MGKGVLKICSKFTGEHPCRSAIPIQLLCNFIEIAFRHECSPVTLQNIFRTPFLRNTSGWLKGYSETLTRFNNFSKTDSKKMKKYMIEIKSIILKIYVTNFPIYLCNQIPHEFKVQKEPPVVFFKYIFFRNFAAFTGKLCVRISF